MAKTKLTDDIRILLALKHGCLVEFMWHGEERPRFSTEKAIHPDGRIRKVSGAAGWRLIKGGLVTNDALSTRLCDYGNWSSPYLLTATGRIAADAIEGVSIDDVFRQPKRKIPPEGLSNAA